MREAFFGGARGGGKTFAALFKARDHVLTYGYAAFVLIVRRRAVDFKDMIVKSRSIFEPAGGRFNKATSTWDFVSGPARGAKIILSHIWDVRDAQKYQGWGLTLVIFEELTQWPTPEAFLLMYACLRSGEGVPTQLCATGNPGFAGHEWVKRRYIDPDPMGYRIIEEQTTLPTGRVVTSQRMFVPSRLEDNPALYQDGEGEYEVGLHMLGSERMVKAWRYGLWDIAPGGYFETVWTPSKHVVDPFRVPQTWSWGRSFDWGYTSPGSLGVYAISDGRPFESHGREIYFPRGSLVRCRSLYLAKEDKATGMFLGLRMQNRDQGETMMRHCREISQSWRFSVADPSIWTSKGSTSTYSEITAETGGLYFERANNARVEGWLKMSDLLDVARRDRPERAGLWVFSNEEHFLRTVPTLPFDPKDPDDVDTTSEDHIADEARYACQTVEMAAGTVAMRGW